MICWQATKKALLDHFKGWQDGDIDSISDPETGHTLRETMEKYMKKSQENSKKFPLGPVDSCID